jgi:3-isopropylmalate dehydrogenase
VTAVIACLPGDGIGPEVLQEALRVLAVLPVEVETVELPFGGAAIDEFGEPLPEQTLEACRSAQAVLLGAVGGPRWDGGSVRPEAGLLGVRQALDVYANLRPAKQGDVDLVVVRELVGGLYFGARGVRGGFELAASRGGQLISVDKANVLETSRLWRRVATELASDYPGIELRHALVDSFAMELVQTPESVDVVVTENMFGDILSDIAAAVTGGLGLAASASLGDVGPGIFEPVHGSAPDLVGTQAANPAAMLRSLALLLEHALGRRDLAAAVVAAVDHALATTPTADLGGTATTRELGDAVIEAIELESWAAR